MTDEEAGNVVEMIKRIAELEAALLDAADEVESWGAYAAPYFQDKHDLEGTVQAIKDIAREKLEDE